MFVGFAGFFGISTVCFDEDFGGGGVAFEDGGGFDVEGFVGPLVVGGECAEDEGESGELEGGHGEVLDDTTEALDDKPCRL